ncbi:Vms1/Ankzf1 family peptidyl-tRNA hydrolase [Sinomonas mesophila]|uniref:baeRF2 domain-containing protein n=1 Tax=Sinomonas mesophila TaxID=1531955 RepID=UPI000986A1EA|nr:Vms1/Ankzf1 family peptidyl-tRNA hydrolase [Sinomonas mesophila]
MRALEQYADLLRGDGPWCTIYADVSTGTIDSLEATDVLGDSVARALAEAGADKESTTAAERLTWAAKGMPAPVSRFVVIRGGEIVVNEVLPGAPGAAVVDVGPIPDLLPLAEHLGGDLVYLVVEAERADAEIRRHRASEGGALDVHELHGTTENLTKVPSGGWSQGRYQHRTEEIWRRNGADVAHEVDALCADGSVALVVLAGDERAQEKIRDALGDRARSLLHSVDMNSAAPGADRERFEREVGSLVAEAASSRRAKALERTAEGYGALGARGWGETVAALQQARVDTLFMDPDGVADRSLLALGAPPWIALHEGETLNAPVLGQARPAAALLRAAVLTDAETVLVPHGDLDAGHGVSALLRWE